MNNTPTDAELIAFAVETGMRVRTGKGVVSFARAVLTRWGQPSGVAYEALHDVDSLAQEIRRVDGAHRLGAGALAEALMPFLRASHGQAPAQAAASIKQPCSTCAALARTVMLDQVSFDRKPDCYGIRQITDDEGVEEWEDIRTSPDVAREEANDMMATGRGEIYEVVPLWTTPQPAPTAQRDVPESEYQRGYRQGYEQRDAEVRGALV